MNAARGRTGDDDRGGAGDGTPAQARYTSQDATHCVEVIAKGFKCCRDWTRCLTNICNQRISVQWRVGGGGWGLNDFDSGQCRPVEFFADSKGQRVEYRACSWDPRAGPGNGPFMSPQCRY